MKSILNKHKIALHICMALAAGSLAAGCASNGNKKTETAETSNPAPVVASIETNSKAEQTVISAETVIEKHKSIEAEKSQAVAEQNLENPTATVITYPDVELSDNTKPEQLSFQFGFDKAELSEEDKNIVMQHARFLVNNPEVILKIQGHTDHHGPKEYNEYLSKKRAESVAKILIEEGVQESQLEIVAMADDAPLAEAEDARMNRRVELQYSEINLVSND